MEEEEEEDGGDDGGEQLAIQVSNIFFGGKHQQSQKPHVRKANLQAQL